MRNLKRALSLGLTAAMISGLMVMGSSAASYADVTSENNQEAIDVLQAVGIMVGDENGNFNPDQNVTRNEMAVIMANLMEYNVASYKDTSPFTDVPSWAEPYVAACWTNGITSGYSDTIYGGSDNVTTAQAALMLMKALGYFQYASDFGGDWQLATTRQGNAIDLFVGVDSGVTAPMTRDDVAQLVLNTLEAGTVTASTDGSWSIGDVTIVNNVKYDYVTSGQPYATAIDDRNTNNDGDLVNGHIVELGEQLYMGDLKLNDHDSDDFMRPSRTWSYEGAEIGTYVKKDLIVATYTEGVTGRELYDLLTSATIKEYGFKAYLNGSQDAAKLGDKVIVKDDLKRSNNDDLDQTGTGVLTEVFLDLDTKEITVTSIDTWLARANSDYNENSETLSVRIYDDNTSGNTGKTEVLDLDEIPAIEGVVKDQYLLVNRTLKDRTDYETVVVSEPEILTDVTITKFSTVDDGDQSGDESLFDSLTADGNPYDAADEAHYNEDVLNLYDNDLLTDMSYNVYLDPYGNAIGVDLYEGSMNYVFITGYDRNSSNLSISTVDAGAIFLDGTMEKIEVNVTNANKNIDRVTPDGPDPDYDAKYDKWTNRDGDYKVNRWFTYTENNGVYTLKPVNEGEMLVTDYTIPADETEVINCSNVWVEDNAAPTGTGSNLTTSGIRGYGNDDSVYITVKPGDVDTSEADGLTDGAITEVTGLYTGVQNVDIEMTPDSKGDVEYYVYTLIDDDQYIIASIVLGEAQGSVENYAYILDAPISEERLSDGTYVWEFDVVMGGVEQTLQARSKYQDVISELKAGENTVMELRFDADEYVTGVDTIPDGTKGTTDKIADFDITGGMEDYEIFDDTITGTTTTLWMNGRTMQIGQKPGTAGLTFVENAPTALYQEINNKWVRTEYASVQDAYNDLGDANTSNAYPNLQFEGRIVAVLNSQGVAEWAYIISDTPINSNDQGGSNTPSVDGEPMGMYTNLADVNAALKDGDVVIDGNWQPQDVTSTYRTLTIPANRTLQINGDFDVTNTSQLQDMIVNGATGSCLVVNGEYVMNASQNTVNYEIFADNLDIDCDPGTVTVNVNSDVTVEGDLNLRGKLTVNFNGNVQIGGDVTDENSTTMIQVNVYGTTNVAGDTYDHVAWNVLSAHSLTVDGEVKGSLTLGGSTAAQAGFAKIGTMNGTVDLVNGTMVVTEALGANFSVSVNAEADVTLSLERGITVDEKAADALKTVGVALDVDTMESGVNLTASKDDESLTVDSTVADALLMAAANYQWSDKKTFGTYTVDGNTVTITVTEKGSDKGNATGRDTMIDATARFLGALHAEGAKAIEYNETSYAWNDKETLKGSMWTVDGKEYVDGSTNEDSASWTRNSLTYYIFGSSKKGSQIKKDCPATVKLVVDGESVTLNLVFGSGITSETEWTNTAEA